MKNKLSLLRSKLEALLGKLPKLNLSADSATRKVAAALMLVGLSSYLVLNAPTLHSKFLRKYVGQHVYKIQLTPNIAAGGTGFAIKGASGTNYIVTNSHVCEGLEDAKNDPQFARLKKNNVFVVDNNGVAMERRIIAVSDKSDLCLVEGMPNDNGLSLGSEAEVSDIITAVGHPHLIPLTQSSGEVIAYEDVPIIDYIMKSGDAELDAMTGARDGTCDLPKNKIIEEEVMTFSSTGITIAKIKLCLAITKKAYNTSLVGFPGNSGSPCVDKLGRVVGVLFGGDGRTHYSAIVNFKDLEDFLAQY